MTEIDIEKDMKSGAKVCTVTLEAILLTPRWP